MFMKRIVQQCYLRNLFSVITTIILLTSTVVTRANAEDWDVSSTLVWTTATLSQARNSLAATSAGGKVFFAGGESGGSPSNVVDIYDTATDSWTTATLSQARWDLLATSAGGKVFFGGGIDGINVSSIVDIYDTVTDTWTTKMLSQSRRGLSTTSVGGKVFFGGGNFLINHSDVVDIYDTATDSWSTDKLSQARTTLAATSAGGKAFFGGGFFGLRSDVVDIYDTATDSWSIETLSQARNSLSATSANGKVFFGGGTSNTSTFSNVVDIYDTTTDSWTAETLSQPRHLMSATSTVDKVFFGGGFGGLSSDIVDIYDTTTDSWSTETLSMARQSLAATSVGDTIFFGGGSNVGSSDVVDIYGPLFNNQLYNSITSIQVFTLVKQTTVTGHMQLNTPGSLNFATFDLTVGSISGDAPINLSGNTLTVGSDNTSPTTYTGTITGGGELVKVGTGKLTLNNQIETDITVNQGRVELGPNTTFDGNVTIASGARLENGGGTIFLIDLNNGGIWDWNENTQVNGIFVNSETGDVRVGASEKFTLFSTASHSNAGLIEVIGNPNLGGRAEFESIGQLTNIANTGLIAGRSATLRFTGGLDNQGSIALSFGTSDVFGNISNSGNITIAGSANVTFYDDVTDNGGTINVGANSSVVFFGSYNGSTTGSGTLFISGDLRPGNSPAAVSFGGDVQFSSTAQLNSELGGTTAGSQFDQVNVIGEVTLSGMLDVSLINSFLPEPGDQFIILTYANHQGEFDSVQFPSGDPSDLVWQISYGEDETIVTFLGLPGDINLNGTVDADDMADFVEHYGTASDADWQSGDFNADGKTNLDDLLLLKQHFGESYSSSPPSPVAVPEPSALLLTLFGCITIILFCRK